MNRMALGVRLLALGVALCASGETYIVPARVDLGFAAAEISMPESDWATATVWTAGYTNVTGGLIDFSPRRADVVLVATPSNTLWKFAPSAGFSDELVVNGSFDNWTSDDPDGWAVVGESGTDPMVTEVAGALRIYTSGSYVYFIQENMVSPGSTYQFLADCLSASSGNVRARTLQTVSPFDIGVISSTGLFESVFVAVEDSLVIERNASPCDITLDNVSLRRCWTPSELVANFNTVTNASGIIELWN